MITLVLPVAGRGLKENMNEILKPLKTESLTEIFISRFEELILSGKLSIGGTLPSERELALKLGVSRPVVHEGLLDLESKGLVTIKPRSGTVVNDYRTEGSLSLLSSLLNYKKGYLDINILKSILDMRMLFEVENAKLAALNRNEDDILSLENLIKEESLIDTDNLEEIIQIDFKFHLLIALASGNMIYPMLLNSFEKIYINLTGKFFTEPEVYKKVFNLHSKITEAIKNKDSKESSKIMTRLLIHGAEHLKSIIK